MQTPIGTPVNKRLIFLASKKPNWDKQLIYWIKRDRRVICITDSLQVRSNFWMIFWKFQIKHYLNQRLDSDLIAMEKLLVEKKV